MPVRSKTRRGELGLLVRWLSGRKQRFAKAPYLKRVPRVRIPPSPHYLSFRAKSRHSLCFEIGALKRYSVLLAILGILVWPAAYSLTRPDPERKTDLTLVSLPYRLDKIYRSMEGPMSIQSGIRLATDQKSAVQWLTGMEAEVVDATQEKPISQEFFCHSNLTFAEHGGRTIDQYNQQFGGKTHLDWRLFTLVPGRLSIELPPGFGVPIPADAPLDYVTMSLNLNEREQVMNVRMRTKLHTIAGDQPEAPNKALFRRSLYVLQARGESAGMGPGCTMKAGIQHVGAGCGEILKSNLPAGSMGEAPGEGLVNHWIVPPGHHFYTTEITPQLNLPFDTTIHYATIHVHPFARGMELRDLTTGIIIFRLNSHDWADRIGVEHVDEFKSSEGIPIFHDHRYQLTAEYDNTSDSKTDAMAILYLYLLDKV